MRGLVPGARTPRPLLDLLPAVLQEDPVVERLTLALDEVLAPAFASLDCLPAYLDPLLAPDDFLAGLASWVGVPLDDAWPRRQRREAVVHAVELHRCRGTARGLQWQLDLMSGGLAEVVDSGGVRWSRTPTGPEPATEPVELVVRVRGAGMSDAQLAATRELVAWAKPAHVPHRIEVAG
ncbi:phage tail protein [Amycolatopsis sp. NPDC049252]|uniref:phage tail protein n=1 Tax=Amycolatopsis sp. NPDC049252 TaxID=3363933 RepID=UPI003710ECE4